jgi:hypothetical protein
MVRVGVAFVAAIVNALLAAFGVGDAESVTVTVKFEPPTVVGAPEITPAVGSSVKPLGRLPAETDHVYGEIPPVADKAAA